MTTATRWDWVASLAATFGAPVPAAVAPAPRTSLPSPRVQPAERWIRPAGWLAGPWRHRTAENEAQCRASGDCEACRQGREDAT